MKKITVAEVKFNNAGLVDVIVQDRASMVVLVKSVMSQAALSETLKTGLVTLYSPIRGCLWRVGENSGHRPAIISILANWSGKCLLLMVDAKVEALKEAGFDRVIL
ncbi:MAG TPA: phosphoribosyl-AMP cyclohydrolase [Candidatus Moranbacteria bacterium]|nr:phosphoribosyl-AMP cyclohydrolase [Candidatus Moranbacteria bacterium]